jgi:hypothetical protein
VPFIRFAKGSFLRTGVRNAEAPFPYAETGHLPAILRELGEEVPQMSTKLLLKAQLESFC